MAGIEVRGESFADFDDYLTWARAQVCIDCGAKASEKTEWWATEIQCSPCCAKFGPPENRKAGPGARAAAATRREEIERLRARVVELQNALKRISLILVDGEIREIIERALDGGS